MVFEDAGMVVMVVGGPNQRVDFHDDPGEEFFYQLRGDMVVKVAEAGRVYDVPIREGEVFLLPPHLRHSPQRPVAGSLGLVVESPRGPGDKDGFEWFCFGAGRWSTAWRSLPPTSLRTCRHYLQLFTPTNLRADVESAGASIPGKSRRRDGRLFPTEWRAIAAAPAAIIR